MNGKRLVFPSLSLEEVPYLKDKELHFSSVAEMLVKRAREIPSQPYVYFYDQTITYSETNRKANQIAGYLKERGTGKGDVVSVMVLNSPEVYYTMFGIQKLGAIAGAINYMLKGPEIAYLLDDCRPKVAFVGSEFMKDFAVGYEMANHKPIVVEVTEEKPSSSIVECTLADILSRYEDTESLVPQDLDDPFLLLYSSGTTGQPKGILLSNRAQLALCRCMAQIGIFQGNDVILIVMPMFHTNPICVWSYPAIYGGHTLCVRKGFSPSDFWSSVLEYGVTVAMGVPAMYSYIYNSVDPATIDKARLKLRYAVCGAAPLPVSLIQGFKEKFNVDILEGYGLTEVIGLSTVNPPMGKKKPGSIGMAIPGQRVEIMDDHNNILPCGEKGEICTAGEFNMIGYLNRPQDTKETIVGEWLHTGDVGYMDEEGYFYIVDRKKDMINRGGENIYPREVEIAIEGHPKVAEVAIIGVPDPDLGERVKAFIVPKSGISVSGEEIKDFLKDKLAKYKIPEFVEVTNDLPRNPTGKIMKKELKRLAKEKR